MKRTPGGTRVPAGPPPVATPEKEVGEEKAVTHRYPRCHRFRSSARRTLTAKVESFDPRRIGVDLESMVTGYGYRKKKKKKGYRMA